MSLDTVAAQIMDVLETLLTDDREEGDVGPEDFPLQPPLVRDRALSLAKRDLDIRILNWGPDAPRIQEAGRPPTQRGPMDRRSLVALLAIRCRATDTLRASQVADRCVAWTASRVCGDVQRGSALYGLADRVYLAGKEPKLGPGDPATFMFVVELVVDYWTVVNDATRVT